MNNCMFPSTRCMLIDNNGFLVYHPDAHFRYKHLIQLEPKVAFSLIERGHMQQAQCKDFAWKLEYYTWKVSLQADTRQGFYEILEIENTNVYVIVVDVEEANNSPQRTCESCLEGAYGNETAKCERVDDECKCPCFSQLDYVSCENTFNEDEDDYVVCSNAVTQQVLECSDRSSVTSHSSQAPTCYAVTCPSFGDEFECLFRVECQWCNDTAECSYQGSDCPMPTTIPPSTTEKPGGG